MRACRLCSKCAWTGFAHQRRWSCFGERNAVRKHTIHVILQIVGISNLNDDMAKELGLAAAYGMREIMLVYDGIGHPDFACGCLQPTMFSVVYCRTEEGFLPEC